MDANNKAGFEYGKSRFTNNIMGQTYFGQSDKYSRLDISSLIYEKYTLKITKAGGVILLLTGIAILTGQLQILGFFILEYFPFLGNFG